MRRDALGNPVCQTTGGCFIPGCMGAAAMGKRHCTCKPAVAKVPSIRRSIYRLYRAVEKLQNEVERMRRLHERKTASHRARSRTDDEDLMHGNQGAD